VPNDPLRAQLSRRQLLKRAGLVGAAVMATPMGTLVPSPAVAQSPAQGQSVIGRGRVWETLSAAEAGPDHPSRDPRHQPTANDLFLTAAKPVRFLTRRAMDVTTVPDGGH